MKKSLLEKELARQGLNAYVNSDGEIKIEPSYLRLQSIKVKAIKRGMYITDPGLVPPELKDANIHYVNEPPVVTGITESGAEITIDVIDVQIDYETVEPSYE